MRLKPTLDAAIARLTAAGTGSPRLNAEVLLMFTLGCDRAYLYAHAERELSADESARYDAALAERARGKPAQYITGHQEFWGLDLLVSPAVLIPRPETEHVVETVLQLAQELMGHPEPAAAGEGPAFRSPLTTRPSPLREEPASPSPLTPRPSPLREGPASHSPLTPRPSPLRIVDVGTGSGCIALALAKELPAAEIVAVDISAAALEIARANAARFELTERVRFLESNLLNALLPPTLLPSTTDCHPERSRGLSSAEAAAESKDPYPADRLPADPGHSHDAAPASFPVGTGDSPAGSGMEAGDSPAHFDFVVSNPPYVGSSAPEKVQREVREFEPQVAVFAGESGLEVYRQLIPQARAALRPGGWLVMEIGYSMEAAVRALLAGWPTTAGWQEVRVTHDLQGIPRVIAARSPLSS